MSRDLESVKVSGDISVTVSVPKHKSSIKYFSRLDEERRANAQFSLERIIQLKVLSLETCCSLSFKVGDILRLQG